MSIYQVEARPSRIELQLMRIFVTYLLLSASIRLADIDFVFQEDSRICMVSNCQNAISVK
ncbi:hypothetical protein EBR21_01485 [bacterium]|nr:hypothetical protein [bacterium]